MQRLSTSDYDILLGIARELHAFRELADLRTWLLEVALPRLIPSDWFSYNEVDLGSPEKTFTMMRPDPGEISHLLPRFAELSHQHPIIADQLERRELPVRKISDYVPRPAYHKLDLYQDVYRPMGVEYQISAALETRRGFITAFALSRKRPDYTERDRSVLDQLRGQLCVAMGNLLVAEQAHRIAVDYGEALTLHSIGVLVIDQHGRILHHRGSALTWLGLQPGASVPAKLLAWAKTRCASPVDLRPQSSSMKLSGTTGELMLRALPSAQPNRLVLTVTSMSCANGYRDAGLGLSARETEVARWICEGKANAQIALILGISTRTVQKHMEHIFERLGVESRLGVAIRFLGSTAPGN